MYSNSTGKHSSIAGAKKSLNLMATGNKVAKDSLSQCGSRGGPRVVNKEIGKDSVLQRFQTNN